MNKIALLSLVLASGAAFAAEPGSYDPVYTQGNATRAAVQAEFAAAAKNDTLPQTGEVGQLDVATQQGASRDRAAVQAEGRQAARAHSTFGEI